MRFEFSRTVADAISRSPAKSLTDADMFMEKSSFNDGYFYVFFFDV